MDVGIAPEDFQRAVLRDFGGVCATLDACMAELDVKIKIAEDAIENVYTALDEQSWVGCWFLFKPALKPCVFLCSFRGACSDSVQKTPVLFWFYHRDLRMAPVSGVAGIIIGVAVFYKTGVFG